VLLLVDIAGWTCSGSSGRARTYNPSVNRSAGSKNLALLLVATIGSQAATDVAFHGFANRSLLLPIDTEIVGTFTKHTHKNPHRKIPSILQAKGGG
jgi:hypothetical protein